MRHNPDWNDQGGFQCLGMTNTGDKRYAQIVVRYQSASAGMRCRRLADADSCRVLPGAVVASPGGPLKIQGGNDAGDRYLWRRLHPRPGWVAKSHRHCVSAQTAGDKTEGR